MSLSKNLVVSVVLGIFLFTIIYMLYLFFGGKKKDDK